MCGFFGFIDFDGNIRDVDKSEVLEGTNNIKYRGPDDSGYFSNSFIQTYGEEKFDRILADVLHDIWFPMGDKAYIRLGYHNAVEQINKTLFPERYLKEEKKYVWNEEDFIF